MRYLLPSVKHIDMTVPVSSKGLVQRTLFCEKHKA